MTALLNDTTTHTAPPCCAGKLLVLGDITLLVLSRWQYWYRTVLAHDNLCQWCGLTPKVLGQDRSETKKIGLGLALAGLVCVVKHGLVTLVVIMILKDIETFQVLFIVSLFCAWNITTVEINSGVLTYLKVKSVNCLCLLPVVLVLLFWSWFCKQRSWS